MYCEISEDDVPVQTWRCCGTVVYVMPNVKPVSSCNSATVGSLRGGIGIATNTATSASRGVASSSCATLNAHLSVLTPGGALKKVAASTCDGAADRRHRGNRGRRKGC
jgi:hypothetical protein